MAVFDGRVFDPTVFLSGFTVEAAADLPVEALAGVAVVADAPVDSSNAELGPFLAPVFRGDVFLPSVFRTLVLAITAAADAPVEFDHRAEAAADLPVEWRRSVPLEAVADLPVDVPGCVPVFDGDVFDNRVFETCSRSVATGADCAVEWTVLVRAEVVADAPVEWSRSAAVVFDQATAITVRPPRRRPAKVRPPSRALEVAFGPLPGGLRVLVPAPSAAAAVAVGPARGGLRVVDPFPDVAAAEDEALLLAVLADA